MDMLKVKEIREEYLLKAREEDYDNNVTNDIYIAANDALIWYDRIGTDADTYTGGEATRRFERAMEDLKTLIG